MRLRTCINVPEGKVEETIEVTGIGRGRRKQLLDDLEKKKGYWKLKQEAVDRTVWRTGSK